jgi:GntR family transcriptional regulator/MocR family aminotransferase
MVVPKTLTELFVRAKAYTDRQSPLLEQYALTDFIEEGHFERHLRRTRALYAQRREALMRNLSEVFGDQVSVAGERAGMHVMARFSTSLENDEVVRRAAAAGVFLTNAQPLYLNGGGQGEFVLGFAELDEARIREGVRRLGQAFGI